jgi:hypothetical protein
MAYGIAQEIDQLKDLSIQELMRRQSVDPQLVYAIALQEKQKMEAAKERQAAMGMQPPEGTVVGQMEQDLASRVAPGVQMQGQRSMPAPQPQMARGISAAPAPNMGRVGMAQGGIVGYAQGGMPKVGAKSKGPIPQLSPEENAQMLKYLEGLKKFDYYDKNPDKVSPEGRKALELDRQMFEEQFSNAFKQKVNDMMYGPSEGMAMGGRVKGYAGLDGSVVEGEDEFTIVARGPNGEQYTADDVRLLMSQGAIVREADETPRESSLLDYFNPDPGNKTYNEMRRRRAAEQKAEELRREQEKEDRRAQQAIEQDSRRQNREEQFKEFGDRARAGINVPLNAIGQFIEDLPGGLSSLATDSLSGARDLRERLEKVAQERQERAFADETGKMPPTREQAAKDIFQRIFDERARVEQTLQDIKGGASGQPPAAGVTQQGTGTGQTPAAKTTPPPQTPQSQGKVGGILDGLIGLGQVLGRGGGASKGFETAKIAEEGRRIRSAEADRQAKQQELDARLKAASDVAMQDRAMEARQNILTRMEVGDLSEIIARKEKELEDKYSSFGGLYSSPRDKENIASELAAFKEELLKKTLRDELTALNQFSGVGGQAGIGGSQGIVEYTQLPNQ